MSTVARAALLAAIVVSVTAPAESMAATPFFALKPVGHLRTGFYRFHAAPGQTVSGKVRVINVGKTRATADLAVVDGTTGATTGAVYQTVGSRSSDVGAWLKLDTRRLTLDAGASQVVGFTLRVPAGARRGQHLGGLVARPVTPRRANAPGKGKHSFQVTLVDQSIVAVQVDLPGAARRLLAVRGVRAGGNPGYQTLLIALSNPGERMVKGSAVVKIVSASGAVRRQPFNIDTFLARTRIEYPLVIRGKALLPGHYRATVDLRWDGGHTGHASYPFTVTKQNIVQAYGANSLAKLPGAKKPGSNGILLVIGVAVALLLLGLGAMLVAFRRRTRALEARVAEALELRDEGQVTVRDQRVREHVGSGPE